MDFLGHNVKVHIYKTLTMMHILIKASIPVGFAPSAPRRIVPCIKHPRRSSKRGKIKLNGEQQKGKKRKNKVFSKLSKNRMYNIALQSKCDRTIHEANLKYSYEYIHAVRKN